MARLRLIGPLGTLKGRHAHLGGRTIPIRAKNLTKIAAAYPYEGLSEPGIGNATATEISFGWRNAERTSEATLNYKELEQRQEQ